MKSIRWVLPVTLCIACTSVSGHLRPFWNPAWSSLTCARVGSDSAVNNVQVALYYGSSGQPLPGAEVTATQCRSKQATDGSFIHALTDAAGNAALSLPPGTWEIRVQLSGTVPVRRSISIEEGVAYHLDLCTVGNDKQHIVVY